MDSYQCLQKIFISVIFCARPFFHGHILVVILGSVGLMVVYGWRYGFIEGVCVTTVVGFSVDFVAHVSIAYVESSASDRRARTAQALSELGISVMSGALSTVLACFFLTRATMYPFIKLGVFMMSNMALSAIITLVVLLDATSMLAGIYIRRNHCK